MTYKQIRKLRDKLDLTQFEFALKLKVSEPTVRNWEREKGSEPSNLGLNNLRALMVAEGIKESDLQESSE